MGLSALAPGYIHVYDQYFRSSSLIPLGQSKKGVKKVYINGPSHMTKMAATPIIYVLMKNNLLQWGCLPLPRGYIHEYDHHFQSFYSLKHLLWPSKRKFHVEPPCWEVGQKFYINGVGHMTKMAAAPIYMEKNLLQNQKSYDLETWHAASGTQALQSLYKCDICHNGLTLTYFRARSNWVAYTFEWGKLLPSHLMRKTCSKD